MMTENTTNSGVRLVDELMVLNALIPNKLPSTSNKKPPTAACVTSVKAT